MEDNKVVLTPEFGEVISMIRNTRNDVYRLANTALIDLYWRIGQYISLKIASAEWGEGVVKQLSAQIEKEMPGQKGFSDKNLWRMKQFYETYLPNAEKLSPLLRQISWTNNLMIISRTKSVAEREFYLQLCINDRLSSRQLERQIRSAVFERSSVDGPKLSAVLRQMAPEAETIFRDQYVMEFVGGKAYDSEYEFFHRELQCLVAFEMKMEQFKPEHLGQLNFYLEALDRDVKKDKENPSIGVLLCKDKDNEVVEYALSRSLSPTLVAEYQLCLPDKKRLQEKMRQIAENTLSD